MKCNIFAHRCEIGGQFFYHESQMIDCIEEKSVVKFCISKSTGKRGQRKGKQ